MTQTELKELKQKGFEERNAVMLLVANVLQGLGFGADFIASNKLLLSLESTSIIATFTIPKDSTLEDAEQKAIDFVNELHGKVMDGVEKKKETERKRQERKATSKKGD